MKIPNYFVFIFVLVVIMLASVNIEQNLKHVSGQLSNTNPQQTENGELSLPALFDATSGSVVQINVFDPSNNLQQGLGSGFVYDNNGYIITNNHVVSINQGNSEFIVTFLNGNSYQASLVGTDPFSDLGVLKLNQKPINMKPLILADSSNLKVGQTVVAIGNPFGLSGSLTVGVISGLGRLLPSSEAGNSPFENPLAATFNIPNIIQTDAAINPGNSGGPLLNMKGEVIGINSAIYSNTGSYAGIGFAVPSNTIKKVVQSIITTGKYSHPYLGVVGLDITPQLATLFGLKEAKGFLITDLTEGSPASKAGLQKGTISYNQRGEIIDAQGDIIIAIDGNEVRKIDDILTYLESEKSAGESVILTIIRNGQLNDIKVILGPRPTHTSLLESADADKNGNQFIPRQKDLYRECLQFMPKTLCDLFSR